MEGINVAQPTHVEIVRAAYQRVAKNAYGLPEGYYRSDLLSTMSVKGVTSEGQIIFDEAYLRVAYERLDYEEGFPTTASGIPFWEKLDFEPSEAFVAFQAYVRLGTQGSRKLATLAVDVELRRKLDLARKAATADPDLGTIPDEGEDPDVRSQAQAQPQEANQQAPQSGKLLVVYTRDNRGPTAAELTAQFKDWYALYYWGPRAKAHDMFYLDSIRKSREMQSLLLENQHFQDASKLYQKAMAYIEGNEDPETGVPESVDDEGNRKFWLNAKPKEVIDLLNLTMKTQRKSLGLPENAPPTPTKTLENDLIQRKETAQTQGRQLNDDERLRRVTALLATAKARAQSVREQPTQTQENQKPNQETRQGGAQSNATNAVVESSTQGPTPKGEGT